MRNDLHIRPFNKDDMEDYRALSAFYDYAYPEEKTTPIELRLADRVRKSEYTCERSIAVHNGQIAGVGCFEHWESFYHPRKYLLHLIVSPPFQKQGIGSALYKETIDQLEKLKPQSILTWVQKDRSGSVRFAENCGFRKAKLKWNLVLNLDTFEVDRFTERLKTIKNEKIEIKLLSDTVNNDEADHKFYDLYVKALKSIETPVDVQIPSFDELIAKKRLNGFTLTFIAVHHDRYLGLWELESTGGDTLFGGAMTVEDSYRKSGIGMALAIHAAEYAKHHRFRKIIAHTDEHNSAVLMMTEKLGFTHFPAQILFRKDYPEH